MSSTSNFRSVRPKMTKMFDGRNIATRPIPIILDTEDERASISAAIAQAPRGDLVNFPQGPRPNAKAVLGTQVSGGAKVRGGKYQPFGVDNNR